MRRGDAEASLAEQPSAGGDAKSVHRASAHGQQARGIDTQIRLQVVDAIDMKPEPARRGEISDARLAGCRRRRN